VVTVTSEAVTQIRNAAQQAGAEGMALRIAARRETDGSIQYGMGFDHECENDAIIDAEGFTVVVALESQPLLGGAVLDFVEIHPGDFQFIFINPNDLGGSCGSGNGGGGGCGGGCGSGGCH